MKTIKGIVYNFDEVPPSWRYCFCDGCPQHDDCLRYQTGLNLPANVTWGNAVYPTAYRNGHCKLFKQIRLIHSAYGFKTLFSEVKQKDYTPLRDQIKNYLGGHGTYYRYNRGERLLTPEQQEWIVRQFARYGYTKGIQFDHYRDVLDFSE
ncbi:MAG: hypothetical protein J6I61_03560 [Prevotella sp.]|nr:hypothetical protein [Prevotella sp.]